MKPRVHSLTAERAVDMSSIAGYKDTPNPKPRCMTVVNAEITAPMKSVRFDSTGSSFGQYFLNEFERRGFSFRALDGRNYTPARSAHRKNREWSKFTRT